MNKIILMIFTLIIISNCYCISDVDAAWWNSTWEKRKPIEINITENKTNYPLVVNVTFDSDMQDNFIDLRYTCYNGTDEIEASYWNESMVLGTWTYDWINCSWTTNNNTQAYVYYKNNTGITDQSNGEQVFTVFDNFDDNNYNTTKWTADLLGTNAISETGGELTITGANAEAGWAESYVTSQVFSSGDYYVSANVKQTTQASNTVQSGIVLGLGSKRTGSYTWVRTLHGGYSMLTNVGSPTGSFPAADTSYHTFAINNSQDNTAYIDVTNQYTTTSTFSADRFNLIKATYSTVAYTTYYDNVIVRKLITPEPTYSFGAEEDYSTDIAPTVVLNTPANDSTESSLTVNFVYTPNDDSGFTNCSLWTNESGWSLKHSNGSTINNGTTNTISETFGSYSDFIWNVECYDDNDNASFATDNYTVYLNQPEITITLNSPVDNYNTSDDTPDFNFTVNGSYDSYSCELFINDTGYGCIDSWISNTDIIDGLGELGDNSASTVFEKDGTWYLLAGCREGTFYGFNWSGSVWQPDSIINGSLGDIGRFSVPTVFEKDSTWYLLAGCKDGTFYGFNWSGSVWQPDSIINGSLGNIGNYSSPEVFYNGSTWYLISGKSYGAFYGFNWSGSNWQSDSAINGSLGNIGGNSAPTVFEKDSAWYLISGEYDGIFNGFNWSGSNWQSDSVIGDGLKDVGTLSTPAVFEKNNVWYLISGKYQDGAFDGFNWEVINNTATIMTANDTLSDGTYDWYINCSVGSVVNQSETRSINIETVAPLINFSYPTEIDGKHILVNYTYINWTITDLSQDTMIFNWDGSNTTVTDTYINKTDSYGVYTYYVWVNDTFGNSNQTEIRTIEFDNVLPTITISVPLNSTYDTTTIDLNVSADEPIDTWWYSSNGYENTTFTPNTTIDFSVYCYQESANVSTSCGGVSTGTYSGVGDTWYDGNWGTSYSITGGTAVYMNYTKPTNSLNTSLWAGKSGSTGDFNSNMSIPQGCWDYDDTTLIFRYYSGSSKYFQCYNGASWTNTGGTGNGYVVMWEEAMWWDILEYNEGQNNITVWVNDTVGNENSKIIYFAIDTIPPQITVHSPENITYYDIDTIVLNISVDEALLDITYNLNSDGNVSIDLYEISYINGTQMTDVFREQMVTDSNDNIHIAFTKGDVIYYAYYNGSWAIETVLSVSAHPLDISVNSTNVPYIIYRDATNLKYAYRNNATNWTVETLIMPDVTDPRKPNIDIDTNDDIHISFWNFTNQTNSTISYGKINSSGYFYELVDYSPDTNYVGQYNDIKTDSNNIPHIIYSYWYQPCIGIRTKHAYNDGGWIIEESHPCTGTLWLDMVIVNDKIYYAWTSGLGVTLSTNKDGSWTHTSISGTQTYDTCLSVTSDGSTAYVFYEDNVSIVVNQIVEKTLIIGNFIYVTSSLDSNDNLYAFGTDVSGDTDKVLTFNKLFNKTLNVIDGQNNVTVYATDLYGNTNSSSIYLTVENTTFTVDYSTDTDELTFATTSNTGTFNATGQNSTNPAIVIDNIGTFTYDINMSVNTSIESCITYWVSSDNTLNVSEDYNITNSMLTVITNLNTTDNQSLFAFAVYDACAVGTSYTYDTYFDPHY